MISFKANIFFLELFKIKFPLQYIFNIRKFKNDVKINKRIKLHFTFQTFYLIIPLYTPKINIQALKLSLYFIFFDLSGR